MAVTFDKANAVSAFAAFPAPSPRRPYDLRGCANHRATSPAGSRRRVIKPLSLRGRRRSCYLLHKAVERRARRRHGRSTRHGILASDVPLTEHFPRLGRAQWYHVKDNSHALMKSRLLDE